jgi:GGDEF domain-containing protein
MTQKIENEWSSYRLTLLLYLLVLIIPFTFYFVYISFEGMQKDSKIVHHVGWAEGTLETFSTSSSIALTPKAITKMETTLKEVGAWVQENRASKFYIGGQTLLKDFEDVTKCWNLYKDNKQNSLYCYESMERLTKIVENMVYLKQRDLVNMFYWSLGVVMLMSILLIYLVRTYIHAQLEKHAIYDLETSLFNKNYFLSELRSGTARAKRYAYPLTLLSVSLKDASSATYDTQTRASLLRALGDLFISVTRDSDTACRIDEYGFIVLLPFTSEENAAILEKRLREAFDLYNFEVEPELKFVFTITQFNENETAENFLQRTITL